MSSVKSGLGQFCERQKAKGCEKSGSSKEKTVLLLHSAHYTLHGGLDGLNLGERRLSKVRAKSKERAICEGMKDEGKGGPIGIGQIASR